MIGMVLALSLVVAVPAFAKPDHPVFLGRIYADGSLWATKGVAELPAPNGNNAHSFDKLFVVTNGVSVQMPVAEAAPGNPDFNGGRWVTYTATWVGEPYLLTSYAQIQAAVSAGELQVTMGSPPGGPPAYFECPLVRLE